MVCAFPRGMCVVRFASWLIRRCNILDAPGAFSLDVLSARTGSFKAPSGTRWIRRTRCGRPGNRARRKSSW